MDALAWHGVSNNLPTGIGWMLRTIPRQDQATLPGRLRASSHLSYQTEMPFGFTRPFHTWIWVMAVQTLAGISAPDAWLMPERGQGSAEGSLALPRPLHLFTNNGPT